MAAPKIFLAHMTTTRVTMIILALPLLLSTTVVAIPVAETAAMTPTPRRGIRDVVSSENEYYYRRHGALAPVHAPDRRRLRRHRSDGDDDDDYDDDGDGGHHYPLGNNTNTNNGTADVPGGLNSTTTTTTTNKMDPVGFIGQQIGEDTL